MDKTMPMHHKLRNQEYDMSIEDLTNLIPPPETPLYPGTVKIWDRIQKQFKLILPRDYFEYGKTYGSGTLCNGFIRIFNWADPVYASAVDLRRECLKVVKALREDAPAVYPNTPGLMPWGSDENGTSLCWLTENDPDDWPVVVQTREGDRRTYHMSFSSFLAEAFRNRIQVPVWYEPFTSEEMNFTPTR